MGGSSWSDDFYTSKVADKAARGVPTFSYNADVSARPAHARVVHDKLNPHGVTRESRDSTAHPTSTAIGVMFDVTGSMGGVPVVLQKKLPQLMGLLIRKGYVEHPQILMGAIGDARSDRGSLQVGQFESGIEMDDDLEKLWLEGGGGGTQQESYQNALYFFARHTSIDCFEKRGQRGYLFIIGDEQAYDTVEPREIERIVGDRLQAPITTEEIVREARQKYNVFFVIPSGTSNGGQRWLKDYWDRLLGPENVLLLNDPAAVCESIATAIGLCEGTVDLDGAATHLRDAGAGVAVVNTVKSALDPLAKKTALARAGTGDLPERTGPSGANQRL